jgi:hypothetical protein
MVDDALKQLISADRMADLGPKRSTKFGPGRDWVIEVDLAMKRSILPGATITFGG